jgi:hypothetical protein
MSNYIALAGKYGPATVDAAVKVAKEQAANYHESYITGNNFEPHTWVVAAICEGFKVGGEVYKRNEQWFGR